MTHACSEGFGSVPMYISLGHFSQFSSESSDRKGS